MLELYVTLVLNGRRTLDKVPQEYRKDVERIISARKEVE